MIYTASKTKHHEIWKEYRARSYPISSSWIDEALPGQTKCKSELYQRCINEVVRSRVMVIYAPAEDEMKGALIEWGAALATSIPVLYVGAEHSWCRHPLVWDLTSLDWAMESARRYCNRMPFDFRRGS
jgi:hypothetical protein